MIQLVFILAMTLGASEAPQSAETAPPVNATQVESASVVVRAGSRVPKSRQLFVRQAAAVSVVLQGRGRAQSYDIENAEGKSLLPAQRPREWRGESMWTERFWMQGWPGGDLTVRLEAEVFHSAELTVTVHYDDGYQVHPMVSPAVWTVGDEFNINACLTRTGEVVVGPGQFSATIVTPDEKTLEVPLFDDGQHGDGVAGDGIFGRVVKTIDPGRHEVLFHAEYEIDGKSVERERSSVHYAISKDKPARFAGRPVFKTLDYDEDGLFNSLSVEFQVHYPRGATISVHAVLEDSKGNVITPDVTVVARNMVDQQDHVIAIGVDCDRIVEHATDGPFVLRHIRMWDKRTDRLIDVMSDVTTRPFSVSSFDPPKPKEPEETGKKQ